MRDPANGSMALGGGGQHAFDSCGDEQLWIGGRSTRHSSAGHRTAAAVAAEAVVIVVAGVKVVAVDVVMALVSVVAVVAVVTVVAVLPVVW